MQTAPQAPPPVPTYVRLLATALDAPLAPPPPFHDALAQWLDWPRAVALARALDGAPPPAAAPDAAAVERLAGEVRQLREGLRAQALEAAAWEAFAQAAATGDATAAQAWLRRHWQALQRRLQAGTGRLRGELREQLLRGGGHGARLASLDAQLEAVLAPREAALFAAVPARLGEAAAGAGEQALRDLLLAELDARLLPIDGLLAALRPQ